MLNYMKDNFFFFFVCCNGLMDFFVFFKNNEIREYLLEKWDFFYLIYIVLVFNNNEIFSELFNIGVDVNLKIINDNCWIFLMLVVGNNVVEENEDNVINIWLRCNDMV